MLEKWKAAHRHKVRKCGLKRGGQYSSWSPEDMILSHLISLESLHFNILKWKFLEVALRTKPSTLFRAWNGTERLSRLLVIIFISSPTHIFNSLPGQMYLSAALLTGSCCPLVSGIRGTRPKGHYVSKAMRTVWSVAIWYREALFHR